jgi:hypothetical protein
MTGLGPGIILDEKKQQPEMGPTGYIYPETEKPKSREPKRGDNVTNPLLQKARLQRPEVKQRLIGLYAGLKEVILALVRIKRNWKEWETPYMLLFAELDKLDQVIRGAEETLKDYSDHEVYDLMGWANQ